MRNDQRGRAGRVGVRGRDGTSATARRHARATPAPGTRWGSALAQAGQLTSGTAKLRTALDAYPLDGGGWHNLGFALIKAGQPEESFACFENALRYAFGLLLPAHGLVRVKRERLSES